MSSLSVKRRKKKNSKLDFQELWQRDLSENKTIHYQVRKFATFKRMQIEPHKSLDFICTSKYIYLL